ncbi:MAG: alpha/beta fold hydrolase [Deltaproteobacteria bacterium]|nr:alpha/beta fold hydrolase [Deltaproteobacteria bacterium]
MFVDVPAPHGILEAVYWDVPRPRACAVVLHPHPQLGGSMHHHAPYRIARALRDAQVACVRFNFRGVGRSSGKFAEGIGEREDVAAGLAFLAEKHSDAPLWIAGYSFGAWVGLHTASTDPRVRAVLLAGVAVKMFAHEAKVNAPLAVIQGADDEFGPASEVEAALRPLSAQFKFTSIAGADHLFTNQLDALEQAARDSIAWLLDPR